MKALAPPLEPKQLRLRPFNGNRLKAAALQHPPTLKICEDRRPRPAPSGNAWTTGPDTRIEAPQLRLVASNAQAPVVAGKPAHLRRTAETLIRVDRKHRSLVTVRTLRSRLKGFR